MFNLNTKADGSIANPTEERKDTVDIIESAFQGATTQNTQAVEEALAEPTDRPFRLLIAADWDFGSNDESGQLDLNLLKESYRMLNERIESGQDVEIVTPGYDKGSSNMVEHLAINAAAQHDSVTHRIVPDTKEGQPYHPANKYRRNEFLARYSDAALLFKLHTDKNRMAQHMHTCFQEWTPASRNVQPKRVVVVTREQLS